MDTQPITNDRKFKLTLLAMSLVTVAWVAASLLPGLAGMYSELLTGIMSLNALYFTSNVGNKFVVGKHMVEAAKAEVKPPGLMEQIK